MRLKNEHLYWTTSQRSSISYFEERASALAVETHNGERAREQCEVKRSSHTQSAKRRRVESEASSSDHESDDLPSGNVKNDQDWDTKCLNPECDGIHRLRDCPITSAEKKRELIGKYYSSAKKRRKSGMSK